jgi:beta-lactamase superfamily II metal-dependent hydrolase
MTDYQTGERRVSTSYEIDFLPVSNNGRSGDAICMRYGSRGHYKVMVYDGGTEESGHALVKHIHEHYGTDFVDYVVCSHPGANHASGLLVVLREMQVGELWMHRPWAYSKRIASHFEDASLADKSLAEHLQRKMTALYALEQLAFRRGIPLYEPFLGNTIGEFDVLSPSRNWYAYGLIPEFETAPEKRQSSVTGDGGMLWKNIAETARQTASSIAESWDVETLREDVCTSVENESSVVLFGMLGDTGVLLTGDAGIQALSAAADYAEAKKVPIADYVNLVQIPHHGSRNNVSPSVLDRLIGPKSAAPGKPRLTAYVSAARESETHPRKAVVNAFIRRGAKVIVTKGTTKCHYHNIDRRRGWEPVELLKFSRQVEGWR